MQQSYASTFITGFQEIIPQLLKNALPDLQIDAIHDGIVFYRTGADANFVKRIRFFNNTFCVFTYCHIVSGVNPIKTLITFVRSDEALNEKMRRVLPRRGNFTILGSVENQPASIPTLQRQKLERMLSSSCSLTLDRRNPQIEFWLVIRKEGFGFFGTRMTRQEYSPAPGEIRPQLAHFLCALSEPAAQDRFIDPFCGSGAIPLERTRTFPFDEVWATDNDVTRLRELMNRAKKAKLRVRVECHDAIHWPGAWNDRFNKVVTDPPWGLYATQTVDEVFLLTELRRITKSQGIIVLLLSRMQQIDELLLTRDLGVELLAKYDVLVSGQKATVHKMRAM